MRGFLDTLRWKRWRRKELPQTQWAFNLFEIASHLEGLCFLLPCATVGLALFTGGLVAGKYLFIKPTCFGTILELTSIQRTVWIHAKPFPKVLLKLTGHWKRRRGGLASPAAAHFRGSWLVGHSLLNRAKEALEEWKEPNRWARNKTATGSPVQATPSFPNIFFFFSHDGRVKKKISIQN